jgi:hypothetical protein
MKKMILFAVVALLFASTCAAQTMYQTSGRWFTFSQQNYVLAKEDVIQIVNDMQAGQTSGTFASGVKYQNLHPQQWLDMTLKCFKAANPSVLTVADLLLALEDSDVMLWSDDFSIKTTNYYWGTNGVTTIPNYSGLGMNVMILVHGGCPVMKMTGCANPLMPIFPDPVVVQVPDKGTEQQSAPKNEYQRQQERMAANQNYSGGVQVKTAGTVAVMPTGGTFQAYQSPRTPNAYERQQFRSWTTVPSAPRQGNYSNQQNTGFGATVDKPDTRPGSGTGNNNGGNNGGNTNGNGTGSNGRP